MAACCDVSLRRGRASHGLLAIRRHDKVSSGTSARSPLLSPSSQVLEHVLRSGRFAERETVEEALAEATSKRVPGRKFGSAIKGADALPLDECVA